MQIKLDYLGSIELDISKSIHLINNISELIKKKNDLSHNIDELKESLVHKQVEIRELEIKLQQCLRQVQIMQQKLVHHQNNQFQKRKLSEEKIKELRNEYNAISASKIELNTEINCIEREIKAYEERMFDLKRQHDSELYGVHSESILLQKQVSIYANEMKKKCFDKS